MNATRLALVYGPHNNGEDQELAGRMHDAGVTIFEAVCHDILHFSARVVASVDSQAG